MPAGNSMMQSSDRNGSRSAPCFSMAFHVWSSSVMIISSSVGGVGSFVEEDDMMSVDLV